MLAPWSLGWPPMLLEPNFWLFGGVAVLLFGLAKGGFSGLGVLSVPIFSFAVPPLEAAAIMLPVLLVQDVVGLWTYRRSLDRTALAVLGGGALLGTVLAALTASLVNERATLGAVGLIALGFAGHWWWRRLRGAGEAPPRRAPWPVGAAWGAVCGLTSFLAHAGAPPAQVYLLPLRLAPAVFAGTFAWLFFFINLVKLPPYLALGLFTRDTLLASAALAPLAAAGVLLGVALVRRATPARFYPVVYALLVIVGARLLWSAAAG